jgi:DUF2075 family protein
MLAYLATKAQFLDDAPLIEDKVADAVKANLGFKATKSEYESWRNSLGNAMSNVMRDPTIPDDAVVAIEYRLNGRKFRLDFVIAGRNSKGQEAIFIVELKQWTDIRYSALEEHVMTALGGGIRDVNHPSYQAWSYKSHLELYNEYVYMNEVKVAACAYLHNCKDSTVVSDSRYESALALAPVFIHGQHKELQRMISLNIADGIGLDLMERVDSSNIKPSKQLADAVGQMLKGKEEFVLIDEQKTVYEKILKAARDSANGKKNVLIIKGGPGTGKSVISINALATLTKDRLNAKYVTANAAPRAVFQSKLKGLIAGDAIKHLFGSTGSYTASESNSADVIIVDEAHRMKMKSGMFKNLGEDQAKEIIDTAKTSVFFIDEAQKVTWADVGEISRIKAHAAKACAEVEILELTSQFRCGGSDDYMAWLDDVLGVKEDKENYFSTSRFDFRVFDSPAELHEEIKRKNLENNKSRVVAGYCWNWISKTDASKFDIELEEFGYKARWNLASYGSEWIINPKSVSEVGCIHTCQGLEVDYVGVIVGDDLLMAGGELVTNPAGRARTDKSLSGYKGERKLNPLEADAKADEIIRNTYRTLMSRGMKGCYVYFTNPEVAEYFKDQLPEEIK